ncbi:unnamed protein product (macronuclear) [Paramecium tetraurelia]|uniref:Uncharacterized protein n=1 Tax=Paramecium tetraurelia TaxID=5888 RepID=A0E4Z2_PARTE|nr:uncharacterized protein GSPATT00023535001 [Paramecium tetraurelia]CAK90359.1 unnamed protein product [Paramecium tetraurelia]|eukprot:XP_001457756.1 hypothetical protein (macronuclear) [Paramecium tetraurelia strain d4-2]
MANENKFIDLSGYDVVSYKEGYKFSIDLNTVNTFITQAPLEEQSKEIRTQEVQLIYQCKQGGIQQIGQIIIFWPFMKEIHKVLYQIDQQFSKKRRIMNTDTRIQILNKFGIKLDQRVKYIIFSFD